MNIIEKLEIILDTCEAGLLSSDVHIKKRSKILKYKAMSLKHQIETDQFDSFQINAINFLIQTWSKESCSILKLNPYAQFNEDNDSDIVN